MNLIKIANSIKQKAMSAYKQLRKEHPDLPISLKRTPATRRPLVTPANAIALGTGRGYVRSSAFGRGAYEKLSNGTIKYIPHTGSKPIIIDPNNTIMLQNLKRSGVDKGIGFLINPAQVGEAVTGDKLWLAKRRKWLPENRHIETDPNLFSKIIRNGGESEFDYGLNLISLDSTASADKLLPGSRYVESYNLASNANMPGQIWPNDIMHPDNIRDRQLIDLGHEANHAVIRNSPDFEAMTSGSKVDSWSSPVGLDPYAMKYLEIHQHGLSYKQGLQAARMLGIAELTKRFGQSAAKRIMKSRVFPVGDLHFKRDLKWFAQHPEVTMQIGPEFSRAVGVFDNTMRTAQDARRRAEIWNKVYGKQYAALEDVLGGDDYIRLSNPEKFALINKKQEIGGIKRSLKHVNNSANEFYDMFKNAQLSK